MPGFADHFSRAASAYATFRPRYPAALFEWIGTIAPSRELAWDCGTGNGQAASALKAHFREVVASDPSEAQLGRAPSHDSVHYVAMTAEHVALSSHSVDVVTVAQALHWFDVERFNAEVRRVLVPGGAIVVWSYPLLRIDDELDAAVRRFYDGGIGAYWPPERALVDAGYAGIAFPFREIAAPSFTMEVDWTLAQFAGYVETWSAVGRYRKALGKNPVPGFIEGLRDQWGPEGISRRVRWPLVLRAGVM